MVNPTIAEIDNSLRKIGYTLRLGRLVWLFNQRIVHSISINPQYTTKGRVTHFELEWLQKAILMEDNDLLYEMVLRGVLSRFQYFGFLKRRNKINLDKIRLTSLDLSNLLRVLEAKKDNGRYRIGFMDADKKEHKLLEFAFDLYLLKESDFIPLSFQDEILKKLKLNRDLEDEMCLVGLISGEIAKHEYLAYLKTRGRIKKTIYRQRKRKGGGKKSLSLVRVRDGAEISGTIIDGTKEGCRVKIDKRVRRINFRLFDLFKMQGIHDRNGVNFVEYRWRLRDPNEIIVGLYCPLYIKDVLSGLDAIYGRRVFVSEDDKMTTCFSKMGEVLSIIQKETDFEKRLFLFLLGLTVNGGLEFDRSMIFLIDKERGRIYGKMVVANTNGERYKQLYENSVWEYSSYLKVIEYLIQEFDRDRDAIFSSPLNRIIRKALFSLRSSKENILLKSIYNKGVVHITNEDNELKGDSFYSYLQKNKVEANEFMVAPLLKDKEIRNKKELKNKVIGILYVDNETTKRPISNSDRYLLESYTNQVAPILQNALLMNELEESNRRLKETQTDLEATWERITARTAHKIGNPIFAIQSFLKLWEEEKEKGVLNDQSAEEYLSQIKKQTERISSLTADFKRFERKRELNLKSIDLNALAKEVTIAMGRGLGEIKVEFNLESSLPLINGDSDELTDAFQEILRNAIYFMDKKGRLTVSSSLVKKNDYKAYGLNGEEKFIKVEFADTGPGIPDEVKEHIFEPLFTTKPEGTGLGLATVKNIVELHHGKVIASQGINGGTNFIFFFPYQR